MKKHNLYALVAAGLLASGMTVSSASAADLGGNCCADLEERIAELEATTARKGNRKVSLTVSGWVTQQISFWDDGVESNTYIHDLGVTLGSHVKFTGQAQISPGWSAGYVLQIEAVSNDGLIGTDQNTPVGGNVVRALQSYWFVKSDQLGKVSVGLQSQASDNTAILVDGSGSLVPANWVSFDTNNFFVRSATNDQDFRWDAGTCGNMGGSWGDCNGATRNVVRYDSPTFGGFSVSASWGEDDMWDVAARYAGEFSGFKLAAAAAYNEVSDERFNGTGIAGDTGKYFQAGAFLMHVPTGLFGLVNYGNLESDLVAGESETWYGKIGLRTRLSALGHTVFYGEYLNNEADGIWLQSGSRAGSVAATVGEVEVWGAGVVQEVDAAAMSVWLKYRNMSYDDNSVHAYEDFDYVGVGGLINF